MRGARPRDPSKRATTTCPTCGTVFEYWRSWPRKFCSNACKGKATITNIHHFAPSSFVARCESCGVEFKATPTQTRGRFCSLHCYGRWLSENVVGDAHPNKGRTFDRPKTLVQVTCQVCGAGFDVKPSHVGRRVCCSQECLATLFSQSGRYAGENNPGWTGGNYTKYYGPSWRPAARAARRRDQVCQDCGISRAELGRALDVHHLVPFKSFGVERHEEANRLDNLVSLCQLCHLKREWATNRRAPVHVAYAAVR